MWEVSVAAGGANREPKLTRAQWIAGSLMALKTFKFSREMLNCKGFMRSGAVVQWLAVVPQSKQVWGSNVPAGWATLCRLCILCLWLCGTHMWEWMCHLCNWLATCLQSAGITSSLPWPWRISCHTLWMDGFMWGRKVVVGLNSD